MSNLSWAIAHIVAGTACFLAALHTVKRDRHGSFAFWVIMGCAGYGLALGRLFGDRL